MKFVETSVFTRRITAMLDDEEYRQLQSALSSRPRRGAVIKNSSGLRKIRWGRDSVGRRGGLRVIYYFDERTETFFMLFAYAKNDQENLTDAQLKVLRRVVDEELR